MSAIEIFGPCYIIEVAAGTTLIHQTNPTSTALEAARGPVYVLAADVSGVSGNATLTINRGTWSGSVFTKVDEIGYVAALSGTTNQELIMAMVNGTSNEAIQIVSSATSKGHVRIQGKTAQVSP